MSSLLAEDGHAFVTLFDRHYLARGLLMARSLHARLPGAKIYAVCLDADSERLLRATSAPEFEVIALSALEAFDPRLPAVRSTRSQIEYYFTLSPALPRYLFAAFPQWQRVTYLDADLYFYADPTAALLPVVDAAITAIEHRYSPLWDEAPHYGRFNVGWLGFRRQAQALACLERWQDQCLEYCPDEPDTVLKAYGDQRYLDEWPERYDRFAIITHAGANLAPWNLRTHRLAIGSQGVEVDGQPLLFFHFHGLKRMHPRVWDTSLMVFGAHLDALLRRAIYRPYLRALEKEMARVNAFFGSNVASSVRPYDQVAPAGWWLRLKFLKRAWKGQYLHV